MWSAGEKAREKAVAIEREMGRERERRDERSCGDEGMRREMKKW